MQIQYVIRRGEYYDSVTLMQIAQTLIGAKAVDDAAVVMATEANKAILRDAGLLVPLLRDAGPGDLVIVVKASTEDKAHQALELAQAHLAEKPTSTAPSAQDRPRTIHSAKGSNPKANVAVISVAGAHAAAEAWEALRAGLHVFLFSDNVSVEAEVSLKEYAVAHDLLMMGPGCGTAIINGVGLGFANAVPRGPVGIVTAAGTGLQEITSLLARRDVGISQAIGTGGRDLSDSVGGIITLQSVAALQADPATRALIIVSKPPSPAVAQRVLSQVGHSTKPTVVCFLGSDSAAASAVGAIPARTLQEAAYLAAAEVEGYEGASADEAIERETVDLRKQSARLRSRLVAGQQYPRGLFSGGTLASEALVIWRSMVDGVRSNVSLDPGWRVDGLARCKGNCAWDLGAEELTIGRLHPMIDSSLRTRRLIEEASDPTVAAIVLDVVLGHGAHPDPASELAPAVALARETALARSRELLFLASVTGTEADPQIRSRQVEELTRAGVIVCASNAAAARLAGLIIRPRRA